VVHPAHPNPFRGSTTLEFELSAAGPVWASVHDLSGRLVRTLANGGALPAGRQFMIWDGRDDAGRPTSAGIYFQRVRTAQAEGATRVVRLR
jgi:hypothetical protein